MDETTQQEIDRLNQAVDTFTTEMKARLRDQAIKGYRGWDDPTNYHRIADMILKHAAVTEGEEVDAANLAMILWFLRRATHRDKCGSFERRPTVRPDNHKAMRRSWRNLTNACRRIALWLYPRYRRRWKTRRSKPPISPLALATASFIDAVIFPKWQDFSGTLPP